ncbi:Pimeloyl-ACP methyl ester carboxylesterase [Paenibacillus sp. cl6col]|uniref:Alpha/beta hydrolase n=1 Tax=Paenibacillus alvei TaxID=44250 RepID=A0ABT4EDI9_PAEAL|nr:MULTISPECIES: alpha/beta hydrolase [Paenibacillus]MCY9531809.1 alpha/beta hydrolase [Paenibacillus alvei]SDG07092.1 Pimeloyl-ACP methyl ester carboxylesterase [Paenibacillus sp. cl6col]
MPKAAVNGMLMHYESKGKGLPVLFLHGSGSSWRMWEPQFEAFSARYSMIMPDYRGHGDSTKEFPEGKYDHYVIVEDLKCFLDELGLNKVHVIGVSQGGQLATLLAIRYPQYIDKLVISNSYSEMPTVAAGWVLSISNFLFSLLPYRTIVNLMMKFYKDDPYTQQILRNSFSIDKKMLLAMKTAPFPTHTNELYRIQSPALVMGGERKIMTGIDEGKGSRTIYNHINHATLALFRDAYDPLSTMRRDIFNEMIIDFFEDRPLRAYNDVVIERKQS